MKAFTVVTTSLFDRLAAKLAKYHPELPEVFESAIAILKADPHNLTGNHPIKRLRAVKPGEGQYGLRIGGWRFRYDIWKKKQEVELGYCGLRQEDTY